MFLWETFIELGKKVCVYIISVSSPLDRSKRFTLHPIADVFIQTPTRLIWEAFSHVAITWLSTHISTTVQIIIYTWAYGLNTNAKASRKACKGASCLVCVRHSTAEIPFPKWVIMLIPSTVSFLPANRCQWLLPIYLSLVFTITRQERESSP